MQLNHHQIKNLDSTIRYIENSVIRNIKSRVPTVLIQIILIINRRNKLCLATNLKLQLMMEVPSTGVKVSFRPFLIKEQKILMIAQEQGGENMITNTVVALLKIVQMVQLKIQDLPTFGHGIHVP